MNNDLISREALKKAIEECKYCGFYGTLIDLIDNAPTIEPQAFINGIVEVISKNGITTINELLETLKGGAE